MNTPITCPRCGQSIDPERYELHRLLCKPLTANWWNTGPWKPPVDNTEQARGPVGYFNPTCRHERCSYDILNCDACIAYTKKLIENRAAALLAEDALATKGNPPCNPASR